MNYFGHALVARERGLAPAGVLGAMLPDFASMSGARLAAQTDPAVAAGVALHHRTDAVFHQLPIVKDLMHDLERRLAALGCARGPTLAVGHIGIELILDGALVDDAAARASYVDALAQDPPIAWAEPGRYDALIERLRGFGVPDDLKTVESIVYRLRRVMTPRPRLAPSASDLVAIERALGEHQPRVLAAAAAILRRLETELGSVPAP